MWKNVNFFPIPVFIYGFPALYIYRKIGFYLWQYQFGKTRS